MNQFTCFPVNRDFFPKTDLEDFTDMNAICFFLRFQDCEVKRVRKEEEEKYKKKLLIRESQLKAEVCRKEEEVTQKLKDGEDRLAKWKQSLEDDLQMKQKHLQEEHLKVAHTLQQVEVSHRPPFLRNLPTSQLHLFLP